MPIGVDEESAHFNDNIQENRVDLAEDSVIINMSMYQHFRFRTALTMLNYLTILSANGRIKRTEPQAMTTK